MFLYYEAKAIGTYFHYMINEILYTELQFSLRENLKYSVCSFKQNHMESLHHLCMNINVHDS